MLFRCYTPGISSHTGAELQLTATAAHHIVNVLRHRPGDTLILFGDNQGDFVVKIVSIKPKVSVEIIEHRPNKTESQLQMHLYQGIARNDRMDTILQKATELGTSTITPLQSEKVQLKISQDKWPKKRDHWEQILISAAEQSGRCVVPRLNEIISLKQLSSASLENITRMNAIVLDPKATQTFNDFNFKGNTIHLFIGPESGFSDAEIDALSSIATPLRLGPRILRTETAAIAALTLCQGRWGDFND